MKKLTFDEYYYRVYLPLHRDPVNRALHGVGIMATLLCALMCVLSGLYWGLLAVPFVVYPFAWTGHLIEGNKPAAFSNPLWAKAADFRMCYDTLMGYL